MANTDAQFRLDYLSDCTEPEQFRPDPVLLFCMNGDLSVTVEGERLALPPNGVLVINPNRRFSLSAGKQCLACRLTIPAVVLKRYLAGRVPLFWCNSVQDSREEYDRLRSLLRQLLGAQLRNPEQPDPMALSYFYELLDCLLRYFLTEPDEGQMGKENQEALRLQEITEYIEENYARHLSLNDLAEYLHLTYSYLSRYLKKALGMNFLEYLYQVRLRHAVEDLLYTDKPITYVAVDNGFVNSSGLNKAFKEAYDMTPSAYKAKLRGSKDDKAGDDTGREKLYGQLRRYLNEQGEAPERQRAQRRTQILADGARKESYRKNWEETINIGRASDLLKSRVREQLLYLRDTLGFRYVRFWSVLDADMELRAGHDAEQLNFDRLDEILDFITGNGMIPYIEFGNKPKTILRNSMEMVMVDEGEPIFHNIPEFQAVLRKFFHHLVTRYRAETVKNWRFECWDDDRYDRQSESVSYFEIFNTVCDTIRSILPEAVIGGCGMKVSDPDMESFLRQWMLQPQRPDFFSVMVYP
ncbi:MAG: helix-turn-helix domain-containing protein, partial [Oscillospiraceae bacterium]|nr:helix-turn-helix domain-containing protein [Oscillospiraceae bacterium]